MGCDIHAHFEVKLNGEWHHAHMPSIKRSYTLFSKMANVRNTPKEHENYIEPISEPRGLPSDITVMTKFHADYMNSDGHSHSWLSAKEVADLIKWYDDKRGELSNRFISWESEQIGYFLGNGWDIISYPSDIPKGVEDIRLVFWFDN